MRLYMEVYAEVALFTALNMKFIDWDSPFPSVVYSNWLSMIFGVLILGLPPIFAVFYSCKWRSWNQPGFTAVCGAQLEGTNLEIKKSSKWKVIVYTQLFYLRRLVFAYSVLMIEDFVLPQLPIQMFMSTLVLMTLMSKDLILESRSAYLLEVFNEACGLLLFYPMFFFTDFMEDVENRNWIGRGYVLIILINISVNFFLLLRSAFIVTKLVIKQKCRCLKKQSQALAFQSEPPRRRVNPYAHEIPNVVDPIYNVTLSLENVMEQPGESGGSSRVQSLRQSSSESSSQVSSNVSRSIHENILLDIPKEIHQNILLDISKTQDLIEDDDEVNFDSGPSDAHKKKSLLISEPIDMKYNCLE